MAVKVGRCLLQDILRSKRMEQVDLAYKLKVTPQQVNKYVRDVQGMSLETAKNISLILNCKMDDLYEWIEVGNKE